MPLEDVVDDRLRSRRVVADRDPCRGETGVDRATTGSDGSFSLPAITRRSMGASVLPHQPLITQKIVIRHDGEEYPAWELQKKGYNDQGELQALLKGGPHTPDTLPSSIDIVCELTSKPTPKGAIYGICEFR